MAFPVIPVTVTQPGNWHAGRMQVYLSEQADGSWRVGTSEGEGLALPTLAQANSLADVFISILGVRADLVVLTADGRREEYGYEEEESAESDGVLR